MLLCDGSFCVLRDITANGTQRGLHVGVLLLMRSIYLYNYYRNLQMSMNLAWWFLLSGGSHDIGICCNPGTIGYLDIVVLGLVTQQAR